MEIKKYSDISASLNGGDNSMGWTNTMLRSNALPIDSKSIFKSLDDAIDYIDNSKLAYEGQIIAITVDDKQVAYVVDSTATNGLRRVGNDPVTLSGEISAIAQAYAISVDNIAHTDLSIALSSADGTGDVKTVYTLTQGNSTIGTINIPKDKVISSAYMVTVKGNYDESQTPKVLSSFTVSWNDVIETVTESSKPEAYAAIKQAYNGPEGGDGSYIRITVTNDEAAPIYIAVPQLVDTYEGGETTEISVGVQGKKGETRLIYADIKAGSIAESKLCSDFTDKVANVIAAQAADRSAIETLSGDEDIDGSVKKALKDAKAYADEKIEALSATQKDIGADETLSTFVEEDGKVTITTRKIQIAQSQVTGLDTTLTELSDAAVLSSKNYTDSKITALVSNDIAVEHQFVTAVSEKDGIVSVIRSTIASADISDMSQTLTDAKTEVKNTVIGLSTDLSTDNTIWAAKNFAKTRSDFTDAALAAEVAARQAGDEATSAYVDTKISGLDASITNADASKTVDTITEVDGIVSATFKDIAIAQSQVNNLTDDLAGISSNLTGDGEGSVNKRILDLSTSLSNTVKADYVKYTDLNTQLTGDNKVATMSDVAGLSGCIHFIGTFTINEGETAKQALVRTFPTAKKGDVAINIETSKEYIYVSDTAGQEDGWKELGDEGSYVLKTTTINGYALSSNVTLQASDIQYTAEKTIKQGIDDEIAAREAADLYISSQVSAAIANYLSGITLNGENFSVENHIATLSIDVISCGGAN